jgi:mono/diheme cytochrome c family protein
MPAWRRPWRVAAIAVVALGMVIVGGSIGAAGPAPTADPADAELVALGEQIYAQQCASCHGADLEGQPNWQRQLPDGGMPAPPHDASGHTWHHPDVLLFGITKFGGQALAPAGFKGNMPPFADQLSDREIWAVLAFIKSRWPADIQAAQQQRNKIQN